MFLLCKKCSSRNNVQRLPCKHNDHERSWFDTYTSIDMQGALRLSYKVVEYIEVWHYREGGGNMFEEFILNIDARLNVLDFLVGAPRMNFSNSR